MLVFSRHFDQLFVATRRSKPDSAPRASMVAMWAAAASLTLALSQPRVRPLVLSGPGPLLGLLFCASLFVASSRCSCEIRLFFVIPMASPPSFCISRFDWRRDLGGLAVVVPLLLSSAARRPRVWSFVRSARRRALAIADCRLGFDGGDVGGAAASLTLAISVSCSVDPDASWRPLAPPAARRVARRCSCEINSSRLDPVASADCASASADAWS